MKKVTFAIFMALLLTLAACTSGADVSQVIEDVAEEVGNAADQVAENADEIAETVEEAADAAIETAEEVMTSGLEELTVAYFLEWPTPNQFAQIEKLYDDALGIPVNWVSFDTGVAMSAAMASGDVHIAYSQGLVPFANAVSAGLDLQTVGIAVSYAENDNCVARTDLGITRDNVTDLHGMQVAVPIGTVAHYKMLKEMEYLGVDVAQLEMVDLAPADGAAALQRGDVAMSCGWGGGLARMKEAGNIIMTGAEMEDEIGLKVFDVVSVTGDFAKDHGDVITAFLQVTEDANAMFAADSASMMGAIADAAGMDLESTAANLATFSFPTASEQLSDAWLGASVQGFVKEVADFFVEQGELDSSLDSYDAFINTSFLEGVVEGMVEGVVEAEPEATMDAELDELTVAYFLEWPTPNQFAQIEKLYDDALGIPVNWVSFDTGVAMSAAMASGDVHIAYSQGLVPFANAVSAGLDLQTVGIAVSYAENDNCVVRTDLGITRENVTDLHGMQVAVPIGTVAHYKMLKEMEYLGVDVFQLEMVDLAPADGAAALQRGDVAMSCGWGGGLARMKEAGNIIMTGAEMEDEIGLKVFDVVSVTGDFAKNHGNTITTFLQVTEEANAMFAADSSSMMGAIADAAGMDMEATESNLATFSFPTAEEQLSDAWLGASVQGFVKEVADFFVEQGELESALDSYDEFINTSFLERVVPVAMDDDAMMEAPAIDPVSIAIVMPSATTDLAWSQSIYDALVTVQGMYDEGVVTIEFTEGMFIVTDAAAALRDYADGGADIVIAHGTQFGTSLFELSPDFPDTAFLFGTSINTGADEGLTNISAYDAQAQEGGYVNGVIAASLSESGIIGVVGPVEAGDAKLYIDGFVAGATATNPDVTVQIAYTGSFGDTALAAEVANTHIASGADVLTGSAQQVVGAIGV
ncbi:MAG: taurine transport system substrate-binding protein, partial [Cellvibrionaceae bacterium]